MIDGCAFEWFMELPSLSFSRNELLGIRGTHSVLSPSVLRFVSDKSIVISALSREESTTARFHRMCATDLVKTAGTICCCPKWKLFRSL